jgi:hypothetical protein
MLILCSPVSTFRPRAISASVERAGGDIGHRRGEHLPVQAPIPLIAICSFHPALLSAALRDRDRDLAPKPRTAAVALIAAGRARERASSYAMSPRNIISWAASRSTASLVDRRRDRTRSRLIILILITAMRHRQLFGRA